MWWHHKSKHKTTLPKVEIGSKIFNDMIFCLKKGVNKDNITLFDCNGFRLHHYDSNIYLMVVYSKESNGDLILMVVSPAVQNHKWAISFCRGRWNKDHEVVQIDPLNSSRSTGAGLNFISKYSPKTANRLLDMINYLRLSKRGRWHCVKA